MERDNDDYLFYMHIIKGIGLYEKNRAAIIVASLGGNQLETEIAEFSDNPATIIFNSNLIWETSKSSIKKMKTENLPIKIECFAIDWKNEQEVRTLIGYVLLPIRGIQISMHKKSMEGKPHWHKLLGVNNDWRSKRPEILLFFGITSKRNFINDDYFKASVERYEHLPLDSRNKTNMLQSQQGIYIKLLQDEGLLQVGDSNIDCDIFIVKLMFKHAAHLEHIVNPEERMNKLFRLHYNLLGTPTYCSLIPKGDGIYSIQEKIAIHFKSSLYSLREYFNKILCIPIDLYYNETIVGHKTFRFINLIENDDLNKFQELHGDNNNTFEKDGKFYIEPLFDLPPTASNPFVEYTFSLRYMSTARIGNCEIIVDKPQIAEYIDNLAGGDNSANLPDKLQELPFLSQPVRFNHDDLHTAFSDSFLLLSHNEPNEKKNPISYRNKFKQFNDIKTTKSVPITNFINSSSYSNNKIESLLMVPELPPEQPQPEPFIQKNDESLSSSTPSIKIRKNIPRTFSYNLILQSIKFIRRPEVGIWQISLHHLKADTPFTIVNTELKDIKSNFIEFKNLELQLFFASTDNQILNIIESEPCLLKIYGPRGIQAIAELDNEILLLNIKDKKSGIILLEDENGEKIAMAHIFLYLNDIGINFNSQYKKYTTRTTNVNSKKISTSKKSTKSSYFDENLAYKIVEELEEWKQKQQEQFLIELKRKEINHLAQLTSEWKKRKYEHETKLQEKLEQCSKLTDALEDAYNIVKEKGYDQFEQTRIIEQTRIEFEQIYTTKIIEFNEKIRRLENDTQHQLKLEQLKYMELEMKKNHIESENLKLKNEIDELKQKISDMQKTFLPREQLAGLFQDVRILSERLEEVQKSKDFYKEQWAKIIREVHNMKSEELKKMELHLRKTTSLGVREFLMDEQGELLTEMEELNFVKSLINSNDDFTINDSKEENKK